MQSNKIIFITAIFALLYFGSFVLRKQNKTPTPAQFITYIVDAKKQNLQLYWKDDSDQIFGSLGRLKSHLDSQKQELLFAMNGGMFEEDGFPKGLFIQNHKIIRQLDTASGNGNFYLKPNGVFYLTDDKIAKISTTTSFKPNKNIKFATQSGPMLLIEGEPHSAFKKGSTNLNIRNGVGILPDGNIVFAMSKEKINFYDFADYFKTMGCKNALYLDGFVSKTYCPEQKSLQTDGNFGVIIGVVK